MGFCHWYLSNNKRIAIHCNKHQTYSHTLVLMLEIKEVKLFKIRKENIEDWIIMSWKGFNMPSQHFQLPTYEKVILEIIILHVK